MKTEVKKIDGTKREISIEVSGDVVTNKFSEVLKKFAQEAKVPGFRPGHAPMDIIEKHYGQHAHEQVLKELIPSVYNEAINKESLDVIELPEISEVKLDRTTLTFKATIEISPEISLKNYKRLAVNYKKLTVAHDEIKRSIDSLKEARKIDSIDDNFAKGLGYPALSDLEKALESQIYLQKENQQRQDVENQIVETLLKETEFKVPSSLVNRQLQDLLRHAKVDLAMKGLSKEKIDEQEKELTKNLEPEAKRQVQVYLILAEIAKKEKFAIDDHMPHHVMEFLLKSADGKEIT